MNEEIIVEILNATSALIDIKNELIKDASRDKHFIKLYLNKNIGDEMAIKELVKCLDEGSNLGTLDMDINFEVH